jgi:Helix-turn-helix domain
MLPSVAERPPERLEKVGGQDRRTAADESSESSGWVTTDVAAAALGVSPRTVRRYIDRGDLAGRVEEEGITRAWLVSIDSLQALRDRRGVAGRDRVESAEMTAVADTLAEVVDRMSARLEARTAEAADARARLELTERAESTLREEHDRVRKELGTERVRREQAERERDELAAKLSALQEPREAPETTAENAEGSRERHFTEEAQEAPERRSWWRRFFGF